MKYKGKSHNDIFRKKVWGVLTALFIVILFSFTSSAALNSSSLKAEEIPAYSGTPYIEIAGNVPSFQISDLTLDEYVQFLPLDQLGRTVGGSACLGPGTITKDPRGAIGADIRPSGFHLDKYPGLIEDPAYLYNRCHVIGYQLCGDVGSPNNLFTGTRYLNTIGMLPFENQIAGCIEGTGSHVLYRATPVYTANNLVADGIQLEAYSVEDYGKNVCFNVFVYNVQPGVIIDYSTGTNQTDPNYTAAAVTAAAGTGLLTFDSSGPANESAAVTRSSGPAENSDGADYILNTNTKKFHYPWCASVDDMKEKNKKAFQGTRDEAIAAGYKPCKRCNP